MFAGRDRHAAGHSTSNVPVNWHDPEQPQSHITAATAGAFFPSKSRPAPIPMPDRVSNSPVPTGKWEMDVEGCVGPLESVLPAQLPGHADGIDRRAVAGSGRPACPTPGPDRPIVY